MINRFVDRSRPPGVSPISSEPSIVPHAGWRFSFFFFFFFFAPATEIQAQITKTVYSKNMLAAYDDRKLPLATLGKRQRNAGVACQPMKLARFPQPVTPSIPNFRQNGRLVKKNSKQESILGRYI